ncbi:MAG: hypothetical protein JWQ84_2262 [Mucilaginibacter sp.]|nr:hypothetical protein [Mucilaginibacter sp.]MDB5017430.1 hypothetical protein [Mucilaginibacter sp.]MDB5139576.1 hypothetical protein [Mucilaginibacter sp.]
MNQKSLIDFLVGNGFVSADSGKKIGNIIAKLLNLKPKYVPVRVAAQKVHPAFKNRQN